MVEGTYTGQRKYIYLDNHGQQPHVGDPQASEVLERESGAVADHADPGKLGLGLAAHQGCQRVAAGENIGEIEHVRIPVPEVEDQHAPAAAVAPSLWVKRHRGSRLNLAGFF